MKTKEIKELIEILETSNLDELSYKEDDFELTLKKNTNKVVEQKVQKENASIEENQPNKTIQSPLVGVFYSRPSPDEDLFVDIGDRVEKGDVVCIIEAMKVMNEIKADQSGVVKEILVEDGTAVSFDEDLLVLD